VFLNIDESIFSQFYNERIGRSNFPVNILVGLEILKEFHNLTDEQLFDRYAFDVSFRQALGLKDFNEHILAERTFYYFRSSLAEHEIETGKNLLLTVFKDIRDDIIEELGIKTGMQRTDSAMIGANIKKMSRLMLFHKTLSNLVRDIRTMDLSVPHEIESIVSEDEDNFSYRLKKGERVEKTREIAGYLLALVTMYRDEWRINGAKSYEHAKRLLDEQCKISGSGPIQLKESKDITSSSMQNPSDDEATYRKKNNAEYRGYAMHASETCDPENKIQVVTDVELVQNNIDDAEVLSEKIEMLKEETGLDTMITDGGFVSDDVRAACQKNEVNLVTSAIRGKSSEKIRNETMTSCDFIFDNGGSIIACPMGAAPRSQKMNMTTITANFDVAVCNQCERRTECPAYVSVNLSRIVIDDKRRWIDERTEALKTQEYRDLCGLRPPVEGLMSCVKPKYLRGRTLFRGRIKVKNRMIFKGIAINCKRIWAFSLDFLVKFFVNKIFEQMNWLRLDQAKNVA
jgi:hypothetical protein